MTKPSQQHLIRAGVGLCLLETKLTCFQMLCEHPGITNWNKGWFTLLPLQFQTHRFISHLSLPARKPGQPVVQPLTQIQSSSSWQLHLLRECSTLGGTSWLQPWFQQVGNGPELVTAVSRWMLECNCKIQSKDRTRIYTKNPSRTLNC